MPRSLWSGTISFGLVTVPVKLHTATEEKDVQFHQFAATPSPSAGVLKTGDRIKNKRVSEKSGREVDFKDIVKGYEVAKGKFVIVTPEELSSVDPGPRKTIEIEDFVALDEIDPIYFAKTYYLAPDGEAGARAYALLREAMKKSERVAIGRFVMRTKQYLVALRPLDKVLTLSTLYFSDEVRDWKDLDVPGAIRLKPREMEIAMTLVDSLTATWKPEKYEDTYRERVLKLMKDKAKGKEIVVEEGENPAPVTDLLAALEASVKEARGKRKPTTRAKKTTQAKKAS